MTMRLVAIAKGLPINFAVSLIVFAGMAFPQAAVLGENCDLGILGATETKTFLAFDRELRSALSTQDAATMALLVKYPLRINDDRGSYYIEDATSLQGHFQEIFTPAVRKAVLNERPETVGCLPRGIMYDNGTLWVEHAGTDKIYAVSTVNVPEGSQFSKKTTHGRIEFVCETKQHRVVVDIGAEDAPRYRAWNKPRPLTEKPDMEVNQGKETFEGSWPCSHSIWTFTSDKTQFIVEGLSACYEDSHPPPVGAKGNLSVQVGDKPAVSWWCF